MSQENEVISIRIDLKEGYIETRTKDGSGIRQEFRTGIAIQLTPFGKDGEGATRQALAASQPDPEPTTSLPDPAQEASEAAPARREKAPAIVLPGRLKSTPVDGRPDGHGKRPSSSNGTENRSKGYSRGSTTHLSIWSP